TMQKMAEAGMDAMRINMSHGDYREHQTKIDIWREVAPDKPVVVDLTGPSIRTEVAAPLKVKEGDRVVVGRDFRTSRDISDVVVPGDVILIDDGRVQLEVEKVSGKNVETVVTVGGEIKNKKSVNIPGADIPYELPTDKDKKDMLWGIKNDVEVFFASFVSRAEDVLAVKSFLKENGSDAWVFAKIESRMGVENAEEILRVADGIVVARGDLGVEIPVERVPAIQKELIMLARDVGKPVVVATQMLTSMVEHPFPTRAEVSDVANAVLDGASALMVSNETAVGKYPVEVVRTLARIILANQDDIDVREEVAYEDDADAVALSAIKLIEKMGARFIITPTSSGKSPRKIARFRPRAKIIAISDNPSLLRRLHLVYGVETRLTDDPLSYQTFMNVVEELKRKGRVRKGDAIVGVNVSGNGGTHTIRVTRA
ncbi:TPA: pyruvate kinase, partial [Candidatus Micrarchaeota archaeon]|nr:pyruvate kinase [Candidatus Micrarchaeota archaeon]